MFPSCGTRSDHVYVKPNPDPTPTHVLLFYHLRCNFCTGALTLGCCCERLLLACVKDVCAPVRPSVRPSRAFPSCLIPAVTAEVFLFLRCGTINREAHTTNGVIVIRTERSRPQIPNCCYYYINTRNTPKQKPKAHEKETRTREMATYKKSDSEMSMILSLLFTVARQFVIFSR